jgi:hypothetical protein
MQCAARFDGGERPRNLFAEKQRVRLSIWERARAHAAAAREEIQERLRRLALSLFGHAPKQGVPRAPIASQDAFRCLSLNHLNLSLAARPCVGHIGLNGDVAEWLKAAVC